MTKIIEYEEVQLNDPEVYRFSKEEYLELYRSGFFPMNLRTELIYGQIIRKMAKGELHSGLIGLIMAYLYKSYPNDEFTFRGESPVDLPDTSIPEPDLSICEYRQDGYTKAHPTEKQVLLIIEVANSSLGYDRNRKLELYAKAGIPEYWIVNLVNDRIELHDTPDPENGTYTHSRIINRGKTIQSNLLGAHPAHRFLAP